MLTCIYTYAYMPRIWNKRDYIMKAWWRECAIGFYKGHRHIWLFIQKNAFFIAYATQI